MCDAITIDVSGTRFVVHDDVFEKLKPVLIESGFISESRTEDYIYVARHPACFQYILYYYQCGDLHLPPSVCPGLFQTELLYWNVDPHDISKCCRYKYCAYISDYSALQTFEKQAASWTSETVRRQAPHNTIKLSFLLWWVWNTLTNPLATLSGKVYIGILTSFVVTSICVMCVATMDISQRSLTADELTEYWDYYYEDAGMVIESLNVTQSFPKEPWTHKEWILIVDNMCLGFFTIDIILRVISCPRFITFCFGVSNILDFVAVVSGYVMVIVPMNDMSEKYSHSYIDYLRLLNIVRILRIIRILCFSRGFLVLVYSLKISLKRLGNMIILLAILVIFFASVIYVFESRQDFPSIPGAFWWAIITMTTVGYGDDVPKTVLGKITGSFCSITGIITLAMAVPLFVNNFVKFSDFAMANSSNLSGIGNKKRTVLNMSQEKVHPSEMQDNDMK